MLRSIEDQVASITEQLVADFPLDESMDVVSALTIPLPVAVISKMMGIPGDRADDFKRWSDALTGTLAGSSIEDRRTEIFEMGAYFASLIPLRRENPGEDLVSAISNAEIAMSRGAGEDKRVASHLLRGFEHLWLKFAP